MCWLSMYKFCSSFLATEHIFAVFFAFFRHFLLLVVSFLHLYLIFRPNFIILRPFRQRTSARATISFVGVPSRNRILWNRNRKEQKP
jgi:hypothetical protein